MPILPPTSPFLVDFKKGDRTPHPLPPPGNLIDGTIGEDISALYPTTRQVTTITLSGSTSDGDVTTLVITPTRSAEGSAWADELGAVTLIFTTAALQTLAAVAIGLRAAAADAQTITNLDDLANYQRVRDLVKVVDSGDDIVITAQSAGVRFTAELSSVDSEGDPSSVTSTQATMGDSDDVLRVGIVAVADGFDARGHQKTAAPGSSSTADEIIGVVRDGHGVAPSESGYLHKHYVRGKDALIRSFGSVSVYGEKACDADSSVYVRKTAATGEIAGAVTDTASTDGEILTITPTAADDTLYRARLTVRDFFTNAIVAEGLIEMTSASSATATTVVTGLKTSLSTDNAHLDDYVVDTGTATLILTQAAGYKLDIVPVGPGVLDVASTQAAASDHILYPGAKFIATTAAAGPQAISIPHP